MISVLEGLERFGEEWEKIATELLASKEPWDFSKAPKGGAAKVVSIEFAGLFVTVANRALQNDRLFERNPFVAAYAKAELKPHRRPVNSLTNNQRDKQRRRIQQSMAADMAVLVEFGLFENIKDYVYRITEKGEEIYERLKTTGIRPSVASDHVQPDQRSNGTASGLDSEIAITATTADIAVNAPPAT